MGIGAWVWAFPPLIVIMLIYLGAMLRAGSESNSKPSTERLAREAAEAAHREAVTTSTPETVEA